MPIMMVCVLNVSDIPLLTWNELRNTEKNHELDDHLFRDGLVWGIDADGSVPLLDCMDFRSISGKCLLVEVGLMFILGKTGIRK